MFLINISGFIRKFLLLKGVKPSDLPTVFFVYILIVLLISPLIVFISRDDKVLSEMYCYHRYNGTITDGVAVKNKANIKELLTYFPANPLEGTLLIPPNNSFVMDTIRIPAGEEVKVLNYLNDSSIAYISAQNPWYRSDSRISKREIYGYIPIFMLHTSSAND